MKEGRMALIRTREQFLEDDLERIYLNYMQQATMYAETVN
jgi:ABC-2 type transport system ATP-binding protein